MPFMCKADWRVWESLTAEHISRDHRTGIMRGGFQEKSYDYILTQGNLDKEVL